MDSRTVRSLLLVAVVVGAAAVAVFASPPPPAPAPSPAQATPTPLEHTDTPMDDPMEPELPPNHVPIQPPAGELNEAITWTVPAAWRSVPNASEMLIASYRVPRSGSADEGDLTVVRATGTAADAVERWVGQFDKTAPEKRTTRTVHGLAVTIVEVSGAFTGGGGMSASPVAAPGRRPAWALLGAIVETEGSPYFFKLLGPAATVGAARADFQALIDSVTPSPSSP